MVCWFLTYFIEPVPSISFKCERGRHLLFWMYPASWLLHLRGLLWPLLAIHHEDEVSIHSRGGKEHHNELLQDSPQHLRVHCALQCMYRSSALSNCVAHVPVLTFSYPSNCCAAIHNSYFNSAFRFLTIFSCLFEGQCFPHHRDVWHVLNFPLCCIHPAKTACSHRRQAK